VMFNEKAYFGFFFRRQAEARSSSIERFEAAGDVVFHRHTLANIVKQQGEDKQIAAVKSCPEWGERDTAFVGRVGEFLQVFDRAQRMFVDRVAVIKVAHDQRIDGAKFGKDFHQEAETMHGPQGDSGKIAGQNFLQGLPLNGLVQNGKFRVSENVG